LYYARAGASLSLLSRSQSVLDKTKESILSQVPKTQIITFAADVCDSQAIKKAIDETAKHFGKIDIIVANAGKADPWKKRE
jgi:NADP-dependent 3-hydroxy acid dehydrogenase YdfG